jgi:hypothetical protein
MKRRILLVLLLIATLGVNAQYNNEWIDYNKTYYKFKVGTTGLYRISSAVLQTAGLGSTPAQNYQLWRNGVQVPIYTSVSSGLLGASDYLEFYGEMNDGKPDLALYKNPANQPGDQWSLQTDTAAFFLTVNPAGGNLRINDAVNNVAANVLPPDPYFMYTFRQHYKTKINPGFAAVVGEYVFSSSYDPGEGWSSRDIAPASPLSDTYNLFPYLSGPNASILVAGSGNALNTRSFQVSINGSQVINEPMDFFKTVKKQVTFPVSYLGKPGGDVVVVNNSSSNATDRMVAANYEITYPRLFNFGGGTRFDFELPANPSGNYLEITNFNSGSTAPILYDITSGQRYTGDLSVPGMVRFALPPSGLKRKLAILNASAPAIYQVSGFMTRNFINYSQAANQGDYLIISNNKLTTGPLGNPVENYRLYRSSAAGGSYQAKSYDIDQLVDQFAFGIKLHPMSVRNFITFARKTFTISPRFVLLLGRGILYSEYRKNESFAITDAISLIPTFGSPGSDNLLASENLSPVPDIPIGRIAAVSGDEIENYLQKLKEYELAAVTGQQTIKDKGWMKNTVHAIGGSDPFLQAVIYGYMNANKAIIEDTLLGSNVYSFSKNSSLSVEQLNSNQLQDLFAEGINILTYFGHSSSNTLEFNIDDPNIYSNQGKYPLFVVNGCNAGNFFVYDTMRRQGGGLTLSEKYILAKQRGSIAFVASTHYGIVNYLNIYTNSLYMEMSQTSYGKSIGETQSAALTRMLTITGPTDYYSRLHAEEINIHGDPAVHIYSPALPDYVIEDPLLKISPTPVSVADAAFTVDVKFMNIGKAVGDSVDVLIQRQSPSGVVTDLYRGKRKAVNFVDSIQLSIPINPLTDKGDNKIIVTIDGTDLVTEKSETNNTVSKTFAIIEDEIRPVSPYNYAIVTKPTVTFYASAANPLSPTKNYMLEVDTTELFNSSFKKSMSITASGGLLQFNVPGFTMQDSTVYYWRTAPSPLNNATPIWNSSSFVYLPNGSEGYNQSHYFQMKKDDFNNISLDDDRTLRFPTKPATLRVKTGIIPIYTADQLLTTLDEQSVVSFGCRSRSLQIVVMDPLTLKPWANSVQPSGLGRFDSWPPCANNKTAFEFPYYDPAYRKRAIDFLNSIPDGHYISITNLGNVINTDYIAQWQADTATLGSGNSLYHTLKNIGFNGIDSFYHNIPFIYVYRKGDLTYPVYQALGVAENEYLDQKFELRRSIVEGDISSPWFGPALQWNSFKWRGENKEPELDKVVMQLYGKTLTGSPILLKNINPSTDTTLSWIDAKQYPFLQIKMINGDTVHGTPNQLAYWRLMGKLPPEGVLATGIAYSAKDTLEVGEPLDFKIAFKNISDAAFDSLDVALVVTDQNNTTITMPVKKQKPLISGDTVLFNYPVDTKNLVGNNTLFINFNPNQAQPEQYLFNNFMYKNFYVKGDGYAPTLDVTFDGVHILNRDLVSSKPHVMIKLKDNNKYLLLNDTSLLTVKLKYPDGTMKSYTFDNDTLRFTPSTVNQGADGNTATIDFFPFLPEDGEYELIVKGEDKSGNKAGMIEYKVTFMVINKSMISNLLNYPNPFTTSTAFVFTLTGSQIPQNMRIQILTMTGKIVREITQQELGPIHVGRNITEFKWDGTDQYGQKLANGVYLYRVITNLNGKSIEKYKEESGQTDKYFKSGYGKMYLMR